MATVRELKTALAQSRAGWSVQAHLADHMDLPRYRTGALQALQRPAGQVPALDFPRLLAGQLTNPFSLQRRVELGIVADTVVADERRAGSTAPPGPAAGAAPPPPAGAVATSVDWRNRWGWPWITTIRDQDGCEACWCFSAVALVEAMVRIEHCVWPSISEGDVHKGMGSHCCDCGGSEAALDWVKAHAAADPKCYAWPVTSSACSGCGGTGGGPYDGVTYTPTPDRDGRSVRIPAYTYVGSVADQKKWIDAIGPLITFISVYDDFFSYGTGVYRKQNLPTNQVRGGHLMLVVGYDDSQSCWIVKNSWGSGWGESGFGRIAYGEVEIDSYAKIGLQGTNPDPWTKRRLHNGAMVESGNGALHRNFELLAPGPGGKVHHWWRDNSVAGFPWHSGVTFGNDVAGCPTLTSTTYNRNFEAVHLTTGHRLHHWWFNQANGQWNDGGVFGPPDATGVAGFVQSNYNAPGNFEVVVRTADAKLAHWWRDGAGWHESGRFGANVAFSGASLVQSRFWNVGNFELVCVLTTGQMQHWWRDNDHGMVWKPTVTFGNGVASPPCMVEGEFGAANEHGIGNFELCVAVGGKVQHWWRANGGDMAWRTSATFGHDIAAVLALVEGSYGFNLELVVLRNDHQLQHYWRDGGGWHEGAVIGSVT